MNKEAVRKEKLHPLALLLSTVVHEIKNLNNCVTFNTPILREYLKKLTPILDDYAGNHQDLELFGMTYPEFRNDIFNLVNNLEHASSRINDIMSDMSKFVRNGYQGEQGWVDLNQVEDIPLLAGRSPPIFFPRTCESENLLQGPILRKRTALLLPLRKWKKPMFSRLMSKQAK